MGQMVGADPDQLDGLANAMSRSADRLDSMRLEVGAALNHSHWEGGDADDFRWQWHHQLSGLVHRIVCVLHENSTTLRTNAEQQRTTSAADGGGHIGHSVPWILGQGGMAAVDRLGDIVGGLAPLEFLPSVVDDALRGIIPGAKAFGEWFVRQGDKVPFGGDQALRIVGKFLAKVAKPLEALMLPINGTQFVQEFNKDWRSLDTYEAGVDLAFSVAGVTAMAAGGVALAVGAAPVAGAAALVGLGIVGTQLAYEGFRGAFPEVHKEIHQGFVSAVDRVGPIVQDGAEAAGRLVQGGVDGVRKFLGW